jgi:hypothetical protein
VISIASSERQSHKNKKPAGACCASGPMSTFSIESLRITQRARHVAVMMMMPMRPEMIQNAHLLSPSLNKPARAVNLRHRQKTDTPNPSFGYLTRLTFPDCSVIFVLYLVEVRIPLVAGRAFPISFGRLCERGIAVDPPKSLRQLKSVCGWGPGLRPVHCHPL